MNYSLLFDDESIKENHISEYDKATLPEQPWASSCMEDYDDCVEWYGQYSTPCGNCRLGPYV